MVKRREKLGLTDIALTDFSMVGTVIELDLGYINVVKHNKNSSGLYSIQSFSKNAAVNGKKAAQVMDNLCRLVALAETSLFLPNVIGTMQDTGSLFTLYQNVYVCSLAELLSVKLSDDDARYVLAAAVLALETIHSKNIHFRGISSEKMLIDEHGTIILHDFRMSKDNLGRSFTLCGVSDYMAPEMIANKGSDYTTDLWSLGVLAFELLTGKLPFSTDKSSELQLFEAISTYKHNDLPLTELNGSASSFINGLLDPNVDTRLGSGGAKKGIEAVKNHVYFNNFNWENLKNGKLYYT